MKLNTEAIHALADQIEQCTDVQRSDHTPDMGPAFTMKHVFYPCGGPACLMGHLHTQVYSVVAGDLGISDTQGDLLCAPRLPYAHFAAIQGTPGFITARRAVAVLRNLAATGRVDWLIGAH